MTAAASHGVILSGLDEAGVVRSAELLALRLKTGDMVTLSGLLGAGKSTFARALVRAVLADPAADVPSPTFSILQVYETPRLTIGHADLYRLASGTEADDAGVFDVLGQGALLVEWPERAPADMAADRIDIELIETADPLRRDLSLTGHGTAAAVPARIAALAGFLASPGADAWRAARLVFLQGDA